MPALPESVASRPRLAMRNIQRQKTRTAITLGAIAFGVIGLILSGGFVQDVFLQLGEAIIHSQSGHLQAARQGYFTLGSRKPDEYVIEKSDQIRAQIAQLGEVDDVMARLSFSGLLTNGRSDYAIVGEGIEPDREARLGSFLVIASGRNLADSDRFGIVVGQGVAKALKLQPGDRVSIVLSTRDGAMNTLDFEVVGIFHSFSKDYDARAVRIQLAAAQELLDNKSVNILVVSLKRTRDTTRVAQAIAAMLPASPPLEVRRWEELNDFYAKTVELYDVQFGMLQAIILAMVLLSVTNTVNMTVFERTGEFGTMRALGNRGRDVFILILVENALLGVAGATLGVVVAVYVAWLISAIGIPMPPPPNSDMGYTAKIRVVPSVVAIAFLIGVLATVLASVAPALRVARGSVVDALRQNV